MKLFKKYSRKNPTRKRYGKKGSIKGRVLIVLTIILGISFVSFSKDIPSEFIDRKIIIEDPTKVTYTEDFEKLVKSGKVETVYVNAESPIILFTVKDGTKVKQVPYNTPEGNAIRKLSKQSKKYLKDGSEHDNYISTYRSFNPDTDEFKQLIYSNEIQVLKLPVADTNLLYDLFKSIGSIVLYIVLFKFLFFPSKKENAISDTEIPDVKFDDIAGNTEAKEEMQFFVDYLKNPNKYNKMGAKIPKGILLHGDPGTGKTLLAKAIAGEAGVPFFERSGTDFLDKYVGVGGQRIKSLFKKARNQSPCIIFIDEIDSIGGVRGETNLREYDNILNQLLVELDGFKASEGVILIAATNRIDSLDPALVRPGRFDRHIAIKLPDKVDRKSLLELYFKDKPLCSSVDLEELAGLIYGFSGASIKVFVNEAALVATKKNKDIITKEDIDEAFVKMTFGAHPKKITRDNTEKAKLIAYHEVGHALATRLWTEDTVNKVTIIGTTDNVGGFTSSTPKEELLRSKQDLCNEIRVLYGGRIAEYLLFDKDLDKVTVGASNDLLKIGKLLDIIITQLGMSESILFAMSDKEMSKEEVLSNKKLLSERLYKETLESFEANIDILHYISNILIDKESLTGQEFDELLSHHEIKYVSKMPRFSKSKEELKV